MRVQQTIRSERLLAQLVAGLIIGLSLLAATASGQMRPVNSYADFYKNETSQRTSIWTLSNPQQYTYNKYFYNRPSVSPYSNLMRPFNPYVPAYQTYVVPEQKRRAYQRAKQHPMQASPIRTAQAKPTKIRRGQLSSNYYNLWYGRGGLGNVR